MALLFPIQQLNISLITMSFARKIIPLDILATNGDVNTPAFLVPDGAARITAQFTFSALHDDANLTLQQSADGAYFDPVLDIAGDPVTLLLNKDNTSATINLVNLLTLWIRFQIDFSTEGTVAGTIHSVQYLTN